MKNFLMYDVDELHIKVSTWQYKNNIMQYATIPNFVTYWVTRQPTGCSPQLFQPPIIHYWTFSCTKFKSIMYIQ